MFLNWGWWCFWAYLLSSFQGRDAEEDRLCPENEHANVHKGCTTIFDNFSTPKLGIINGHSTAIPHRASTGPEQGFPCVVFQHRKNYTGKTLFLLQGWVCSVLIVSFSNMSCIVNLSNCCVLVCNFIVFRVYLVTIGPIFVGLSPFQFKLGSFRLNCPRNATICVQVQSSSLKFLNSQLQQQCDKTLQASLL